MSGPDIHINLLKRDAARDKQLIEMLVIFLVTALLAVGMVYFYGSGMEQVAFEQYLNERLTDQIAQYESFRRDYIITQEMNKQLVFRKQLADKVKNQGLPATGILSIIQKAIPPGVTIIGVEANNNNIKLTGFTPSYTQAAQFIAGLKQDGRLSAIGLVSIKEAKDTGQLEFLIEMKWKGKKTI